MTRLFRQNLAIYNKLVFAQQQQFFTKSGLKFYQILKITTQKTYNFLPKCQNLLKSGHTVSTGSKIFPSNLIFPSLPFCPLKPVNLFMRKSSSQHESFLDSISLESQEFPECMFLKLRRTLKVQHDDDDDTDAM